MKTGLDYSWYMGVSGDGENIYLGNTGRKSRLVLSGSDIQIESAPGVRHTLPGRRIPTRRM